eukprot:jgi/Mesvir1/12399/Mv00570-RA.1
MASHLRLQEQIDALSSEVQALDLLGTVDAQTPLRRVGLVYDARMMAHQDPDDEDHPERPERIQRIFNELESLGLAQRCERIPAREVTDDEMKTVHSRPHIELVRNISSRQYGNAGRAALASKYNSVFFNKGSTQAALLSAGSVVELATRVAKGQLARAAAIVRPPGHHAEASEPMGFCLLNNVAVAAGYLLQAQLACRILIVDWDVHHGNATQHMFYDDPRALYVSLHRYDNGSFFPGKEDAAEGFTGGPAAAGCNVNVPWPCGGFGDGDYLAAWHRLVMPVAHAFAPDLVLVSAGFDAAWGDPLGGCCVTPAGYAHLLHQLLALAGGRLVLALEGGYNLDAIACSYAACVAVMLGDPPPLLGPVAPSALACAAIQAAVIEHARFWPPLAYARAVPDWIDKKMAERGGSALRVLSILLEAAAPGCLLPPSWGEDSAHAQLACWSRACAPLPPPPTTCADGEGPGLDLASLAAPGWAMLSKLAAQLAAALGANSSTAEPLLCTQGGGGGGRGGGGGGCGHHSDRGPFLGTLFAEQKAASRAALIGPSSEPSNPRSGGCLVDMSGAQPTPASSLAAAAAAAGRGRRRVASPPVRPSPPAPAPRTSPAQQGVGADEAQASSSASASSRASASSSANARPVPRAVAEGSPGDDSPASRSGSSSLHAAARAADHPDASTSATRLEGQASPSASRGAQTTSPNGNGGDAISGMDSFAGMSPVSSQLQGDGTCSYEGGGSLGASEGESMYVWYAAYGSNMWRDRFLCYLQGGQVAGMTHANRGSQDPSPPIAVARAWVKHLLFFGRWSRAWGEGGVCFLDLEHREEARTCVVLYKITLRQFNALLHQENDQPGDAPPYMTPQGCAQLQQLFWHLQLRRQHRARLEVARGAGPASGPRAVGPSSASPQPSTSSPSAARSPTSPNSHPSSTGPAASFSPVPVDASMEVDAPEHCSVKLLDGWYSTVLCLGERQGDPVLTITCGPQDMEDFRHGRLPLNPPSMPYREVVVRGLVTSGCMIEKLAVAYVERHCHSDMSRLLLRRRKACTG